MFAHIKINEIYKDLTKDDCTHILQETHCSRLHRHSHLSSMSYNVWHENGCSTEWCLWVLHTDFTHGIMCVHVSAFVIVRCRGEVSPGQNCAIKVIVVPSLCLLLLCFSYLSRIVAIHTQLAQHSPNAQL